jgi:hypothetical protein
VPDRLEGKVDQLLQEVAELKLAIARIQTADEVRDVPALVKKVAENERNIASIASSTESIDKLETNMEKLLAWYWRTAGALAALSVGMPFLIRWLFA